MKPRPARLDALPEQYFTRLLARVAEAAAAEGDPVVDLGRGNPEVGPPAHVIEALAHAASRHDVHGYAPFSGLRELKEAVAARYADVYGVEVDPSREVAIIPGAKTALMEFALCTVEPGETIVLPDPGYPDYNSAIAVSGARRVSFDGFDAHGDAAAMYLNFPCNPTAEAAHDGVFEAAAEWARRTRAWILHDFAYGDLVFDGRRPASFLAADGARELGVELFSMSKSYGMAGWRLGFVVGSAELVRRFELYNDHVRAGIFAPLQHAAVAALRGPQDSVEARRRAYESRRDRVLAALAVDAQSEGTFFVWFRLPVGVTAERLLVEQRVAVAPGEGFGARGTGWARLSLAVADDVLDEGLGRLARALAGQGEASARSSSARLTKTSLPGRSAYDSSNE